MIKSMFLTLALHMLTFSKIFHELTRCRSECPWAFWRGRRAHGTIYVKMQRIFLRVGARRQHSVCYTHIRDWLYPLVSMYKVVGMGNLGNEEVDEGESLWLASWSSLLSELQDSE